MTQRPGALPSQEVHVWTIPRDRSVDLAQLASCLSAAELAQAARLRIESRKEAFVYNRARVRQILARYAGIDAAQVPLTSSRTGKPLWGDATYRVQPTFNVAHRGDLALLSVSSSRPVGIDVEVFDGAMNCDALARQTLSDREWLLYEGLSCDQRPAAILRAWTRKEALLKALGIGLSRPLAQIEVTFLEQEAPRLVCAEGVMDDPSAWRLESWSPAVGWIAALAVQSDRDCLHLKHFTWGRDEECRTHFSDRPRASEAATTV